MTRLCWKWLLVAAFAVVALWSLPGMAAKIDRFTDQEGVLHITNAGKEEPVKAGAAPGPAPRAKAPAVSPGAAPTPPGKSEPKSPAFPAPQESPPGADPETQPPAPEPDHPEVAEPPPGEPEAAARPGRKPQRPWSRRMPGASAAAEGR